MFVIPATVVTIVSLISASAVQGSEQLSPKPLSVFDDHSPFYGPDDNTRHVEHMFNLLSDVHSEEEDVHDLPETKELDYGDLLMEHRTGYPHVDQAILTNDIYYYEDNNDLSESDGSYMGMMRSVLKKGLVATKKIKNVFDTVQKVTRIYQDQRREILNNATIMKRMGIDNEDDLDVDFDPNASTASTLLSVVLDPPSLSKIVEVSKSSDSEDEILKGLTAVLLGSEARQSGGSALTLDPVTIIALLTLAAYLIRAVYQILANSGTGRYFDAQPLELPFGLSHLPDVMVRVHNYITGADYDSQSFARSMGESEGEGESPNSVHGVISFPGSVAALTKLLREGHDGCIRLYVCDQLAHRNLLSYSLEDIFVAGIGYYYANADLWQLLKVGKQGDSDSCLSHRAQCTEDTLSEARELRNLFTEASSRLLNLWNNTREAKMRSSARNGGDAAVQK